jgi:DNA-binding transcriptional MerR regulator
MKTRACSNHPGQPRAITKHLTGSLQIKRKTCFRFIFASHGTDTLSKALRGPAVRLHHRSQTTAAERGVVKNLISIGKFSKLTDLSVRTLRLYDELDVLKPAFIDPDTGYRSYRLDQVGTAHRIRAMRQLEMPLHAIRVVMGEPDRARDYLERHRGELRGKLETMQSKLDLLDRAISAHA